jgi:uncharacterized protein YxeA
MNTGQLTRFETTMELLSELRQRAYLRVSNEGPKAVDDIDAVAEEYVRSVNSVGP